MIWLFAHAAYVLRLALSKFQAPPVGSPLGSIKIPRFFAHGDRIGNRVASIQNTNDHQVALAGRVQERGADHPAEREPRRGAEQDAARRVEDAKRRQRQDRPPRRVADEQPDRLAEDPTERRPEEGDERASSRPSPPTTSGTARAPTIAPATSPPSDNTPVTRPRLTPATAVETMTPRAIQSTEAHTLEVTGERPARCRSDRAATNQPALGA